MTRHRRPADEADDSDASFSAGEDDNLFDVDESERGWDTDATDPEDLNIDDADVDADIDVEDQVQLFGGNVHPPEYYRRAVEEFNESAFDCEDYSSGTTLLLDAVEEQWHSYDALDTAPLFRCLLTASTSRYCHVLERDPQQCYEAISLRLLYNFFDWYLNQKVGKDGRKRRGTKKKSSLSTYWKVFRLVFERAMGEKLDPKMNRSMHKVAFPRRWFWNRVLT